MTWPAAATTRSATRPRSGGSLLRLLSLALFLLAALIAATHSVAAQRPPLGRPTSKGSIQPRKNQAFVQLSAPPLARAAANAGVRNARTFTLNSARSNPVVAQAAQRIKLDQERFLAECKAANISATIDSAFSTIVNLISVHVSSSNHIDALRHLPGVLKVFPSLSGPLPRSDRVKPKPISVAEARALFTQPPPAQPHLRRRDGNDGSVDNDLESTDWHVKSLHNMTRLTEARLVNPSLTGKGIKVGVISSGIDWQHEAFVRAGETCENWGDAGCRVTHGWACKIDPGPEPPSDDVLRTQPAGVGGEEEANEDDDAVGVLAPPPPSRRPPGFRPPPPLFGKESITCVSAAESAGEAVRDSCVGVGTNIASVVGGQWRGAVNGVAPEVTFGAYNIRPCVITPNETYPEAFIYTSKLFASIFERAINDQMDMLVIEPTFRYGYHTQDTLEAFLINAASEYFNIPVIVPAGERRDEESQDKQYAHRIESPSHATGALTVTSVTSSVHPYDSINVTVAVPRHGAPIRRRLRVLTPLNPGTVRDVVPVFEKDRWYRLATSPHPPSVTDDGCPEGNHTWPAKYFAGHVAVVRHLGACDLGNLFIAATDARAVGVVFYSNKAVLPSDIPTQWHQLRIPALMVNADDGEWLRATVAANVNVSDPRDESRAQLRMHKRMWLRGAANVTVPAYNRWGPSMDLALKPDIGCVGEHLVVAASSDVIRKPSLAIMTGTRMAAGYIAGLVALVKQQNPQMPALEIMDRVRNAGRPLAQLLQTSMVADSVIKQGAGAMVDAYSLLVPSISVTPSKLELGDVPGFPFEGKFNPNRVVNVTMRNVGRAVEHLHVTSLFAEGVRWGNVQDVFQRFMLPTMAVTPSSIRLHPGEQVEVSLHLNLTRVAMYVRKQWGGDGAKPVYGKRPKPADPLPAPPVYGKRPSKGTRLFRRADEPVDGEPAEEAGADGIEPVPVATPDPTLSDLFPTTDMPPGSPPMYMLSGYISFGSANSTNILASVPYLLFAGEYRGGAYFMPEDQLGTPYLYSEYRKGDHPRDWQSTLHHPGKHVPVFNLTTRGTTPRIGFGLYQPVRKLQLDVIDANTKALVGGIATGHFRAASQGRNMAYMFPSETVGAIWDGELQPPEGHKGPPPRVANGTYKFRVSLYKFAPLTDPERGETPITWTSPPFVVRYNATSDVFGQGSLPGDAVLPWDYQPTQEDGDNSNPSPDPDPAEPAVLPAPTDPSTPSDPPADPADPSPSPTVTESPPSPALDPIGVVIIPGTNSSTSDAAAPGHRLARRDGRPRRGPLNSPAPTSPTTRSASRQQTKRMYILGEWTYTVTTRSSGQSGGGLVLPWTNVVLGDEDQVDDGSPSVPSPPAREEGDELEVEDLPDYVRYEMDQYPGQPTLIGKTRGGRVPGNTAMRKHRKKCIIIRKKAVHV